MEMFLEIKIRKNGEEKWVDARKFFKYMIEEYSKVTYGGKVVEPYPDRVNKFFDEMPEKLIEMWSKAYPNVDIKAECEKARAWLLTNTNKAKKDFKGFTNRWLGKACNNGGQMPMSFANKSELILNKKMREFRKQQEIAEQDSAPQDWVKDLISQTKRKMKK
jgi:hypothetical protein